MPVVTDSRPRGSTKVFIALCVLALAALVAAYSNSLENSFHFDDGHVIEQNLYIRSLLNMPRFFTDATTFSAMPQNATYRPLVSATLALDYWLGGGLDVRQFHLSQLAMLISLGIMVYFLALRIFNHGKDLARNRLLALLAASLFAMHTTNTETLNSIAARSELLSTMGVVGSFLVYFHFPRARRFHAYLLPMVIGALAKTPAVVFAPLLLVYVLLFEKQLALRDVFSPRSRSATWSGIANCLPALVVGAVVFVAVEAQNAAGLNYGGASRLDYLCTQAFVWLHYGRLFFVPIGLTADTDLGLIREWYDTRVLAGVLFIVLLLRIVWVCSRTAAGRPVAFGVAWFALALLPASSIFPLAEVANEHRIFFPFIGASLAVVWGGALLVDRWNESRPRLRPALVLTAWLVAVLAVGGHALGVHERNKVWQSEETLWRDVVEKSPQNGRGLMNYGLTQMAQGKYVEAKQLFERAQVYNPNYSTLETNLAIVTGQLGDPEGAEQHFKKALQLQPDYHAVHYYYARWLAQRGSTADAIVHLERAMFLSPADIDTRYLLLDLYAQTGQTTKLTQLATKTLELVPGDAKSRQVLSDPGSIGGLQPVGPPPPQTAADHLNISLRCYQVGDFQGSMDAARRALEQQPDVPEAYNNIAASCAALGRWDEAIEAAERALALQPDFPLARNNLAWARSGKQKAAEDAR